MPSTHVCLHYHLIFSTKDRIGYLNKDWRGRLHAYMGGIVKQLGGVPVTIGGVDDHVHLLVGLRATHRLSDIMKDLKGSSSLWIHEELNQRLFAWQEGYGAFTVSASQMEAVTHYIDNQEEHHRKKSYQEEYVEILRASGVEYNEHYLW